jgi:hypothetical protein
MRYAFLSGVVNRVKPLAKTPVYRFHMDKSSWLLPGLILPNFLVAATSGTSWTSSKDIAFIRCEERLAISDPDPLSIPDHADEKNVAGSYVSRPSLDGVPRSLLPLYAFLCWSMVMSIWLAAAFGPLYVIFCAIKGLWSSVLTFLSVWLLGGLIDFPEIPSLARAIASGLELWFPSFSIHYEHRFATGYREASKSRPSIYCYHPHGLFSIGAVLLAADLISRGEKIAFVTSSHMRWFNPLAKLMMDIAGIQIVGATSAEVQAAMRKGERSLILVPGGYEEAVFTQNGFERLFLTSRLGFVKFAMRFGYNLVPVYAFGENDLYSTLPIVSTIRDALAKYKIPVAIFFGHPNLPIMPKRNSLKIFVGDRLEVPWTNDPPIQQLRAVHNVYVEKLIELYYENNELPDRPLEII